MRRFELDPRLAADTTTVGTLGLCTLLLMNDRRWPWLILVPQRSDVTEIHDLTPLDQTMLTFETSLTAKALQTFTGAEKINVGALGNRVRMLHVHVVARRTGDANWPGPVWGFGEAEPYEAETLDKLRNDLVQAVLSG
ncbi:MAG: hypothetical protein CMP81_02765 [Fulvimarina sp.]|nr:hypothetical protein [Fulvimarina sp.]